jgi:hypothetical protein
MAPRGIETRAQAQRTPSAYKPPNILEIPPGLPEGFTYRWLRVKIRNEDDTKSIFRRQREGFEFVRADEVPDYVGPSHGAGSFSGVIGQTDLVLGRIPEEFAQDRRQYYAEQTAGQNESIETELKREQHKVAPIQRTLKQTTSGGPRKAAFGD